MKGVQMQNICKQQHNCFLVKGYSSKSVTWFRNQSDSKATNWETKKLTSARSFIHTLQIPPGTKILRYRQEKCKTKFQEVILSYQGRILGGCDFYAPTRPPTAIRLNGNILAIFCYYFDAQFQYTVMISKKKLKNCSIFLNCKLCWNKKVSLTN